MSLKVFPVEIYQYGYRYNKVFLVVNFSDCGLYHGNNSYYKYIYIYIKVMNNR